MNIKKEVASRIKAELVKQQRGLRDRLSINSREINNLSNDSAVTKKQLSMLNQMIYELGGDK